MQGKNLYVTFSLYRIYSIPKCLINSFSSSGIIIELTMIKSTNVITPTTTTSDKRKTPKNINVWAKYVGCLMIEKGPFVINFLLTFEDISGTPIIPNRLNNLAVQMCKIKPTTKSVMPIMFINVGKTIFNWRRYPLFI